MRALPILALCLGLLAAADAARADREPTGAVIEGITRHRGVPCAMRIEVRRLPVPVAPVPLFREGKRCVRDEDWLSPGLVLDDVLVEAQSDEGGRYRIAGLARGHYEIRAVAADGQRAFQPITVCGEGGFHVVDLGTAPGAKRIAGRARHPDGRPFAGWLVVTQETEWRRAMPWLAGADAVETDADGSFEVRGLLAAALEITAVLPGRLRIPCARFDVPPEAPVEVVVDEQDATHTRAAVDAAIRTRVTGHVRVAERNRPAVGAWVHLVPEDGIPQAMVADEQGRFAFEHVREGRIHVLVSGGGWLDDDADRVLEALEITHGTRTDLALTAVRASMHADIKLVDHKGRPCPNVQVWGTQYRLRHPVADARIYESPAPSVTDARGRCRLAGFVPETSIRLQFHHPFLAKPTRYEHLTVYPGGSLVIRTRLAEGPSGRVAVPEGLTPRQVHLRAWPADGSDVRPHAIPLRPDGSFRLWPNVWGRLRVRAATWLGDTFVEGEMQVDVGKRERALRMKPAAPRGAWLIHVLDADGAPVPTGRANRGDRGIRHPHHFGFPIEGGRAAFLALSPSSSPRTFTLHGFRDAEGRPLPCRNVRTGPLRPGVHTVRLEPGRCLRVRVLSADGSPLPDGEVQASTTGPDPQVVAAAAVDASGRALLAGLGDGPWSLLASRRFLFVEPKPVVVPADATEATLVMTPFVEAEVVVTREDGTPVEGARVIASSTARGWTAFDGRGALRLTTDPSGRIRLPPLEPGVRVDLVVEAPVADLQPLYLPAWVPADATLVLPDAGVLRGHVVDADGAPVANATVWVRAPRSNPALPQRGLGWWRDSEGFVLGAITDRCGAFSIGSLTTGALLVRAAAATRAGAGRTSGILTCDADATSVRLVLDAER